MTAEWSAAICGTALMLVPVSGIRAFAQDPPPRVGPFVLDIRGTFPNFPGSTALALSRGMSPGELPGRGLGVDVGAHLYLFKWSAVTVGLGGQLTMARATSAAITAGGQTVSRAAIEELASLTPQLSLNFGTGNGWSYLSGGIGVARWSLVPDGRNPLPIDEQRLGSINYGGGARWFAKSHLAFAVDARFHVIGSGTAEPGLPPHPEQLLFFIGAGVAIK